MNKTLYNTRFYQNQAKCSQRSAAAVVPILLSMTNPSSVVDVGCGIGTWLVEFLDHGIADAVGIDGPYVDTRLLRIPSDQFLSRDLSGPLSMPRHFDLALCVEVAEHLPPARSAGFVADLIALAPVIAFSAAVPEQGGIGHINEQWPEYWQALFARHDYHCLDRIRPLIWHDDNVAPWYRQNLLLYARADHVERLPYPTGALPLSVVHPGVLRGRIRPSARLLLNAFIRTSTAKLLRKR